MSDQLDLIERLFQSSATLRDIAERCEGANLPRSAERLRVVADICDQDGGDLARECNDAFDWEKREEAEDIERKARRERRDAEDAANLELAIQIERDQP